MSELIVNEKTAREVLIHLCRELTRRGLTHGKSGNISIRRSATTFFISPTGVPYDALEPEDIPYMDFDGVWYGRLKPSSEWRFHRDIMKNRDDVGVIVHTHSRYATALASMGRGIPAFHYMVAVAGGADIRCAPYATFGSQELSDNALEALMDRKACLLANHGVIAVGEGPKAALDLAGEVENLAAQYCTTLEIGAPVILSDAEMAKVAEKFRTYGSQSASDDGLTHADTVY